MTTREELKQDEAKEGWKNLIPQGCRRTLEDGTQKRAIAADP